MVGSRYWCKDCKYVWRTKKDVGRPAYCPRCKSKNIVWDTLTNNTIGFMIGVTGLVLFIFGLFDSKSGELLIPIGLIGIVILVIVSIITYEQHKKNKRILGGN